MTEPRAFELAPWRKPLLADDGLVVGMGGPAVVLALGLALVGPGVFHLSQAASWTYAIAGLVAVLALAFALGHPQHRAGALRFADGSLELDLGRGQPFTTRVAALRSAMVVRNRQEPARDALLLHVEGRWLNVRVPLVRLVPSLDSLLLELRAQIERHGDLAAFDRRSTTQVTSLQWTLAACGVIGGAVVLWRMFG